MSRKNDKLQGEGEAAPASVEQLEYLRKLSRLSEAELGKLGKREAAELIDRLTEEQRAREEAMLAPGRRAGCLKGLMILVLLAAIGGVLWLMEKKKEEVARLEAQAAGEQAAAGTAKTPAKPAKGPAVAQGKPAASAGKAATKPLDPAPPPPPSWPPSKLPARYRTTAAVELLAADGTPVKIEAGQVVDVLESTRPNVWKFRHGGRVLVGSSGRVEGKLAAVTAARSSP